MRGATPAGVVLTIPEVISIHTPHAGSDWECQKRRCRKCHFNPHSPCGERRVYDIFKRVLQRISIHTPHAGSDPATPLQLPALLHFNPHSPCGERRLKVVGDVSLVADFNPHSPCGERPAALMPHNSTATISIHTPHAGSDRKNRA